MTELTYDKTVRWLSDYMRVHGEDKTNFKDVRRSMRIAGENTLSCYLLDNKFLYGRLLRDARNLER